MTASQDRGPQLKCWGWEASLLCSKVTTAREKVSNTVGFGSASTNRKVLSPGSCGSYHKNVRAGRFGMRLWKWMQLLLAVPSIPLAHYLNRCVTSLWKSKVNPPSILDYGPSVPGFIAHRCCLLTQMQFISNLWCNIFTGLIIYGAGEHLTTQDIHTDSSYLDTTVLPRTFAHEVLVPEVPTVCFGKWSG